MDKRTLDATARALASLDVSTENAQVAALQAEIDRNNEAVDVAERRCREIGTALAGGGHPDAPAVADALVGGAAAMEAAIVGPGEEVMRLERESLRAGIGELNRRTEQARQEIDTIRDCARQRASECIQPLVDVIDEGMRMAAALLLEGFAAVSAINDATRGHARSRLAAELAVDGVMGMDRILGSQRHIEVPTEICSAIGSLRNKGAALPVRLTTRVAVP
jgi:hypothetical protein